MATEANANEPVLAWWGDTMGTAKWNGEQWARQDGQYWSLARKPDGWMPLALAKAAPEMAEALRGLLRQLPPVDANGWHAGMEPDRQRAIAALALAKNGSRQD